MTSPNTALSACLSAPPSRISPKNARCSRNYASVRYYLACYECLSGNIEEAKRLIAEEIAADPERKEQGLQDSELAAIHEFIATL